MNRTSIEWTSEQLPYQELERLGYPSFPPFREIAESDAMLESYPSFYWVVGKFVQPLATIGSDLSKDRQMDLIGRAKAGLEMFLRQDISCAMLPRSAEKAQKLLEHVMVWVKFFAGMSAQPAAPIETLARSIDGLTITMQEEMDRLPMFTVIAKGNLDIHRLVEGASRGYPKSVLELLDKFIMGEINYAGKCLAFELPTSSGFHILRAVETGMKGYVHAATGALPKMNQRNWGEYIRILTDAGAHSDVIDLLKVLKTKRNPLMHPQDNLSLDDAIGLLCLCQAGIETLVADIRRRSMEVKFAESLKVLPTL